MSRPLACQQCRKVYVKSDRREGPESAELGRRQAPTCHDEHLLQDHKRRWAAGVKSAQVEAVRTLKLSIYTWEGLLDFVGLTAKALTTLIGEREWRKMACAHFRAASVGCRRLTS